MNTAYFGPIRAPENVKTIHSTAQKDVKSDSSSVLVLSLTIFVRVVGSGGSSCVAPILQQKKCNDSVPCL